MQWLALECHLDQSSTAISERFELILGCRSKSSWSRTEYCPSLTTEIDKFAAADYSQQRF